MCYNILENFCGKLGNNVAKKGLELVLEGIKVIGSSLLSHVINFKMENIANDKLYFQCTKFVSVVYSEGGF